MAGMSAWRPPWDPPEAPGEPAAVRTRQSECLGPVQPAAHCSWQQSVGFVPLQRGQPWQMLLVTAGGAKKGRGGDGDGGVPRMRSWQVGGSPG